MLWQVLWSFVLIGKRARALALPGVELRSQLSPSRFSSSVMSCRWTRQPGSRGTWRVNRSCSRCPSGWGTAECSSTSGDLQAPHVGQRPLRHLHEVGNRGGQAPVLKHDIGPVYRVAVGSYAQGVNDRRVPGNGEPPRRQYYCHVPRCDRKLRKRYRPKCPVHTEIYMRLTRPEDSARY